MSDEDNYKYSESAKDAVERKIYQNEFDKHQPHKAKKFEMICRDDGHFDIYAEAAGGWSQAQRIIYPNSVGGWANEHIIERAFCIRGQPGYVYVRDERWNPHKSDKRPCPSFMNVTTALAYCVAELTGQTKL